MSNSPKNAPDKVAPSGKKGRRGAPRDNRNNMRHGLRGSKLPKGCKYIEHRVNALRRQVEDALMATKGSISITDAAAVNSILKWERHGLLAAHWLRHQVDTLSALERLKFSEAIAKASDNRDKALRSLGIDAKPVPWAALTVESQPVTEEEST